MVLDDEARAQLVREWLRSPLKQTEFCAEKGISPRVLRDWTRRFGAGDRPEARALAIIDEALEKLTALRAAVVAEAAGHFGERDEPPLDGPERHAEPEAMPDRRPRPAVEPVGPRPMPGPGFLWL